MSDESDPLEDYFERYNKWKQERPRGKPPPGGWTEQCLCPFCKGTGTITTPMKVWGGEPYPASPRDAFRAAFSDTFWEKEQEHAAGCLSHINNNVSAARESLCEYLFSLQETLEACGANDDACEVIEVLRYALLDLQRGMENPLLATHKKGRATSQFEFELLIRASAAMTALMDEDMSEGKKMSEEEAARAVAKVLNAHGLPLPKLYGHVPREDWKRLQEWRRKCSSGRRGEWAKTMVHEWVEMFSSLGESTIKTIDRHFQELATKRDHFSL